MATFDGSTGASQAERPNWGAPPPSPYAGGPAPGPYAPPPQDAAPQDRATIPGMPDADVPASGSGSQPFDAQPFDALEALRQQMDQRDEEADTTIPVEIPKLGWRLVCDYDLPYADFARMQKASLPRDQRNGRKTNPLDMNQATLSTLLLIRTCVGMEYRDSQGTWQMLLDHKQRPMLINSAELMDKFGAVDEHVFVRKLFGGDAHVIQAGTKVMNAAGYGEGEEADPLDTE